MKRHLLSVAIAATIATAGISSTAHAAQHGPIVQSPSEAVAPMAKASAVKDWIVVFDEPSVANFTGTDASAKSAGGLMLKATSITVTGEKKLNLKSAASKAYISHLAERRHTHLGNIAATLSRSVEPMHVFDTTLNGVSMTMSHAEAIRVAKLPGVKRVVEVFDRYTNTDAGPQWIGAPAVWNSSATELKTKGEGVLIGIIDTGITPQHASFSDNNQSGFSYQNPRGQFLGLCASGAVSAGKCNNKLIGVHDFTTCPSGSSSCKDNESNNGIAENSHGTHVASTAAGIELNVDGRTVSGVAPRANIISYKGCENNDTGRGTCSSLWTVPSIEQAVKDGVDVINYSIGSDPYNPWVCLSASESTDPANCNTDEEAFLGAFNAGVVVVSSAGNDGPGPNTVGSPANAPWVLGVAATTHGRGEQNRLVDLTGGDTAPPNGGVLVGLGSTGGFGPAPLVIPRDHPQCSEGDDDDLGLGSNNKPDGSSNPWRFQPLNRFKGKIVVCQRGKQARVAKSDNVRREGAKGFVLVNTATSAQSVVSDKHSIPGTHLDRESGDKLVAWLSSGGNHQGRIEGSKTIYSDVFGDKLAEFSSRGSTVEGNFMKPNVSAPGVDILAAVVPPKETPNQSTFGKMSGTSMSSPHAAGAAALIKAAYGNDLTNAEIMSLLQTSARPSVKYGGKEADTFGQGAGTIQLGEAVKGGLVLHETAANMRLAKFGANGDPRNLNLPGLLIDDCLSECSLKRTVRSVSAGSQTWAADTSGLPDGFQVRIEPSEFTLSRGATQEVTFNFSIKSPNLVGKWIHSGVQLKTKGPQGKVPATRFPLAVKAAVAKSIPVEVAISGQGSDGVVPGYQDIIFQKTSVLSKLMYHSTGLAPVKQKKVSLIEDPTNRKPWDIDEGGIDVSLLDVPKSSHPTQITVTTSSATSKDVDLRVGLDVNRDGKATETELKQLGCTSASPDASEKCVITVPSLPVDARVWVHVQNWKASAEGAADDIAVTTNVLSLKPDPSTDLVATGPSETKQGDDMKVRVSYDKTKLVSNQTYLGRVWVNSVGANGKERSLHTFPVRIARSNRDKPVQPLSLNPNKPTSITLNAKEKRSGLFVDVPVGAKSVTVTMSGSGNADLSLVQTERPESVRVADFSTLQNAPTPQTNAKPDSNETVSLDVSLTANPKQGEGSIRFYAIVENKGDDEATVSLTTKVDENTDAVKPGIYFDPKLPGSGVTLFPVVGGRTSVAWYTYLQDGTPTWYLSVAEPASDGSGRSHGDLYRYQWDGNKAQGTIVGSVQLARNDVPDPDGKEWVVWTFTIDGQTGSQMLSRFSKPDCGNSNRPEGMWYNASKPGYGFSVVSGGETGKNGYLATATYFYDDRGFPRWMLGLQSDTQTFDAYQYIGACPLCDSPVSKGEIAGSMKQSFDAGGSMEASYRFKAPLSGEWTLNDALIRLTEQSQECNQ